MNQRKYPPISFHTSLNGTLEVNWENEYQGEYQCPRCNTGRLIGLCRREHHSCRLGLKCRSCKKITYLTCELPGVRVQYQPISTHETHLGTLKVNWETDYYGKYQCPKCHQGQLAKAYYRQEATCEVALLCSSCHERTYLSCPVPIHIYRYLSDVACPNPLCTGIGPQGQKGWVHQVFGACPCRCHSCGISFNPTSNSTKGWMGIQREIEPLLFNFNEDTWELRYFFDKPNIQYVRFDDIQPDWYKEQVKRYLHQLLKDRVYNSISPIREIRTVLNQFGKIIQQKNLQEPADISRETVLALIDSCNEVTNNSLHRKLLRIKQFLEWLGLDTRGLVKYRDLPKSRNNQPTWLDEPTRAAIREHLPKIPAPIARHYLVQEFSAARPGDVCQLPLNCLVEENGKWYINFYQQKVKRWHRIPATREIRQVIEGQQQWIRETLGEEYVYLFCHFRSFKEISYPKFPRIKPLPEPPKPDVKCNPMVRIIRYLIEAEDIRDANGQHPHFTGKITRSSRLQEVRVKHGMEAAQLYADHKSSTTTFQNYAPPTQEQIAQADLPFQELLLNPKNKFLPWQSLPESLLQNPKAHELDLEIAPRLVVYGHCALHPKTPCPFNLYPKCYGCGSFRPSTGKLPLYERQYAGEKQRMEEASAAGAELAYEEAKATVTAMEQWLPQLQEVANDT